MTGAIHKHGQRFDWKEFVSRVSEIEAFWEFQFPDVLLDNGVPPLTDDIKRMILGKNALRMMGRDPDDVKSTLEDIDDEVARIRSQQDGRPEPWTAIEPTGASEPMQRFLGKETAASHN